MLKIIVVSFLLLHISLTDAAEVDIDKVSSTLHSTLNGLANANVQIANAYRAIPRSSLPKTLDSFVPNLIKVFDGYEQIGTSLRRLANVLIQNNRQNSHTVYVPRSVLKANYDPIIDIQKNFNNIIASQLKQEILELRNVIRYSDDKAFIPVKNGEDIIATLNYISSEFDDLTRDVIVWGKALYSLSRALKKSQSYYGAQLFKNLAQATVPLRYNNNQHAVEYKNLADAYRNIFSRNYRDYYVVNAQDFNDITGDAMIKISKNNNKIVNVYDSYLQQISGLNNSV